MESEVILLPLFSSSYKVTLVSELADKASVLYLKLWFRENAAHFKCLMKWGKLEDT